MFQKQQKWTILKSKIILFKYFPITASNYLFKLCKIKDRSTSGIFIIRVYWCSYYIHYHINAITMLVKSFNVYFVQYTIYSSRVHKSILPFGYGLCMRSHSRHYNIIISDTTQMHLHTITCIGTYTFFFWVYRVLHRSFPQNTIIDNLKLVLW